MIVRLFIASKAGGQATAGGTIAIVGRLTQLFGKFSFLKKIENPD